MKEIKIEKCPFCGGEEMIETNVGASGGVYVTPAQKEGYVVRRFGQPSAAIAEA